MVTIKCARCGEEKTASSSYFKRLASVKKDGIYYCSQCVPNIGRPKKIKMVVVKCVDCGKERLLYPSAIKHLECMKKDGVYRCGCKRKIKNENTFVENGKRKIVVKCIDCGKELAINFYKFNQNKNRTVESYRCKDCNSIKRWDNPDWREKWDRKRVNSILISKENGKQKTAAKKRYENVEYVIKMQHVYNDPIWQLNNKEGALKRMCGQGFWYGNPIINNDIQKRQIYCELWEDVKPRIAAFNIDNHDGILTCEICETPIPEGKYKFCHHHVFYEKRACCWNNDSIYTTNLNIKTMSKDSYIIGENPNYFAITCTNCHGKTNGNFENRKKWADFLKNKIDTKYDGKSYYTKEEMIERDKNLK